MQPLSTKAVIGGIALVSAAALLTAFVAQFAFGLAPCELCMLQRVPYGAVLLFALLALTPAFDAPTRREVAWLCAGLFAIEAVIAAYHAGVEYHWWPGPTACTGRIKDFSIEDLTNALNRPAPPVQCDQPAFTFHGISMAGANAIAAATFTILTAIAIMRTNWSRP